MPVLSAGISVTVGVIALVLAALMHIVGGRVAPRVTVALIIAGMVAILGTPIGSTIRQTVVMADRWLSSVLASWTGAAATGLLGLVIVGILGFDVWKKHVNKRTLACAAAAPIAAATIPGTVGAIAMGAFTAVASIIGGGLGWAFGG